MLRQLSTADLPALLHLAPLFWAEGKLPGRFVPEVFMRTWESLFSIGVGRIIGYFEFDQIRGALAYVLMPDPNDGVPTATEMFWFVDPLCRGAGLRLLSAFEEEAKAAGAERLVMVHLTSINAPELRHLYERRGYREVETHYLKEIS